MIRRWRMNALAYWGLCPTFSIVQAAFLFCGRDPSNIDSQTEWKVNNHPVGYIPVKTALLNAVTSGHLKATMSFTCYDDGSESLDVDIHRTQIAREDLDKFFDNAGIPGHFFGRRFDNSRAGAGRSGGAGQLPSKLNAALKAWAAVSSDLLLLRGKSPKQALKAWLVEHADELGLRKRDGELNEAGIEEICKVANWRPEGGATPTPSSLVTPSALLFERHQTIAPGFHETYAPELDDEIPF